MVLSRGIECDAIRGDFEFMTLFRKQVAMLPVKFWARYLPDPDPRRHYLRWQQRKALDKFIGDVLDRHVSNRESNADTSPSQSKNRVAIDYALEAYNEGNKSASSKGKLDSGFKQIVISQYVYQFFIQLSANVFTPALH